MANRTIMAIGAHADDVELYVGGMLFKYLQQGYDIVYVMSTNNMSGNWKTLHADGKITVRNPPYTELQPQRKKETITAAAAFDTTPIHLNHPQRHYLDHQGNKQHLHFGSARPDCVEEKQPSILTAFEHPKPVNDLVELILKHQPEVVVTHGPIQVNIEHTGTCLLVSKAFEEAQKQSHHGMLLHWLDITPHFPRKWFGNHFLKWETHIDVSQFWQQKMDAVRLHACQIPVPERVDFPQWGPACNCEYAEVFTVADWGAMPADNTPLSIELANNMHTAQFNQPVP